MEGHFFRVLLKQWITYTFGNIFMRQGILFEYILCDRESFDGGVERFVTHHRHFPSQVPLRVGPYPMKLARIHLFPKD